MQINPDFTLQQVGDSYVAVPVGKTSRTFHAMIQLNEVGAFLWQRMSEKDCTEEELVDALMAEYEGAERATVEADVHRIVETLQQHNIFR